MKFHHIIHYCLSAILATKFFTLASLARVGKRVFCFRALPENKTHLPLFCERSEQKKLIARIARCLLLFVFFTPLSIKAQNKRKKKEDPKAAWTSSRNALEPLPIHLATMGSQQFYGLKLGVDYPIRMTELRGFKGTATGQRTLREQYISADLGLWHYNGVHENIFFSTEWTVRFINGDGLFFQISPLGLGVNYTLKPFITYKATQDSVPSIGKFYATPCLSIGIGKDFAFRRAHRGIPMTVYLKGGASAMYPFQKWGYIFPTAELGLAFRFRGINAFVRKVRRD